MAYHREENVCVNVFPQECMATIKEVAESAGVSITTVSHIVNGTRHVSERLTVKVRSAIDELGYRPHTAARSLRSCKTHMIGLILPDNTNPFFAEIARGVEDSCFDAGYSVILCNTDNNLEKEVNYLRLLENKGVDGIAFVSIGQDHEAIEILAKQKQPHVLIDRYIPDFDCVLVDNRVGARKAVARLIELGHRRIGFISGRRNLVPSMEREQGYREALRHLGINVDPANLVEGDFGLESGNRAALRLLSRPHRPTALFAANDMMAIGALKAARQMALRVPEDLSVIGFDDIQLSSFVSPSLTTVAQPKYTMGRRTAEILLTRIKQPETKTISENLSTRVVERESHGMAPKETAA